MRRSTSRLRVLAPLPLAALALTLGMPSAAVAETTPAPSPTTSASPSATPSAPAAPSPSPTTSETAQPQPSSSAPSPTVSAPATTTPSPSTTPSASPSATAPSASVPFEGRSGADSRRLAEAKLVVANELKLEGWIGRLIKSSGTKAQVIEAAKGVQPIKADEEKGHGHAHDHGALDPHAWQSVANARLYVANIRDGLIAADPAGKPDYEANAAAYLAKLDALENVSVAVKASETGKLFGSVTAGDVADAVRKASGQAIDKRSVELSAGQIKATGKHTVDIALHPQITAHVSVEVVAA